MRSHTSGIVLHDNVTTRASSASNSGVRDHTRDPATDGDVEAVIRYFRLFLKLLASLPAALGRKATIAPF